MCSVSQVLRDAFYKWDEVVANPTEESLATAREEWMSAALGLLSESLKEGTSGATKEHRRAAWMFLLALENGLQRCANRSLLNFKKEVGVVVCLVWGSVMGLTSDMGGVA